MTLILSTLPSDITPLLYPLGTIVLPESKLLPIPRHRHDLPARTGEPAFQAEQELAHTFREQEKSVGWIKSLLGTGVALSPWLVLLGLVGGF
jgi:oligosaccharyltransferase complex subunit delta (ribophorin II)